MKDESLLARLTAYAGSGALPMHMPGHKRNHASQGDALPWGIDITEIEGFDNLHDADGILRGGMERARRLYGSRRAFYLVNGSTGGLLAAITALTGRGDRVLVMRGSHMAVYHAIELNGLRPAYLTPPLDEETGVQGSVTPEAVARALDRYPDVKLCVLTSPTYEGVTSDISSIARLLHARGARLLVDAAHGAHLGFCGDFPASPVAEGADVVVMSLHKTLMSLTQTALLHVCSPSVDADAVARRLRMFETSSPSYVLMASIDECVRTMEASGRALMQAHADRLARFYDDMRALRHLAILSKRERFFGFDQSKVWIATRNTTTTGHALMDALRRQGIELEMASEDGALAMTSPCDRADALGVLAGALRQVDAQLGARRAPSTRALPDPIVRMTIDEALCGEGRFVRFERAAGQISREYVWAYPPGAPLLAPGEEVTAAHIGALAGRGIKSTRGNMPEELEVCTAPGRH